MAHSKHKHTDTAVFNAVMVSVLRLELSAGHSSAESLPDVVETIVKKFRGMFTSQSNGRVTTRLEWQHVAIVCNQKCTTPKCGLWGYSEEYCGPCKKVPTALQKPGKGQTSKLQQIPIGLRVG